MAYFKNINFDPTRSLNYQFALAHPSISTNAFRANDYNAVAKISRDHFASYADTGNSNVLIMDLPQPRINGAGANYQYAVVNMVVSTQERKDLKERFRRRCEHYAVHSTAMTLAHGDLYMFIQRSYLHVAYVTDVPGHVQYLQKLTQTVFWGPILERFGFTLRGKGLYKIVDGEEICISKEWMDIQTLLTGGMGIQNPGYSRNAHWESVCINRYFQKNLYTSTSDLPTHELLTAVGVDMEDFIGYVSRSPRDMGANDDTWKDAINRAFSSDFRKAFWEKVEEVETIGALNKRVTAMISKVVPEINREESQRVLENFKTGFSTLNEYYFFVLSRLPSTLEARLRPYCEAYIKPAEVEGNIVEETPAIQAPEIPAEVVAGEPAEKVVEDKKIKRKAKKKIPPTAPPLEAVKTAAADASFALAG